MVDLIDDTASSCGISGTPLLGAPCNQPPTSKNVHSHISASENNHGKKWIRTCRKHGTSWNWISGPEISRLNKLWTNPGGYQLQLSSLCTGGDHKPGWKLQYPNSSWLPLLSLINRCERIVNHSPLTIRDYGCQHWVWFTSIVRVDDS